MKRSKKYRIVSLIDLVENNPNWEERKVDGPFRVFVNKNPQPPKFSVLENGAWMPVPLNDKDWSLLVSENPPVVSLFG